ncbi:MAG: hypothetical protein HY521_15050 [Proteobacteria bacterium]|nr:hypothetical protein [Pseudomonadota bacterium]
MRLKFVKDHGRIRAGEVKDYPVTTWKTFFPGFARFTRPAPEPAAEAEEAVRRARARPAAN